MVFFNCYKTELLKEHLLGFQPDNIDGDGEIDEKIIKQITNILKVYSKRR